ncbi:related to mitochondrial seryl-tRNA synthetases [Sporisorium reilianum f. sp. reilianum]|uniref:serine--tRNA ligase n=1 Tax=Sporisorium reilianum f. sp. reilianum TaxID=72559 RepID=A0A2N8UFJ0_9BASI|nr:related to mitochondrial seryl-tRNA synthetases [Sporisorium reilianum f. sp. reilianum]
MPVPGQVGPIWRSLARTRLCPSPHPSTLPASQGSWRHASTSRVTLGINKSTPRSKPTSTARANAKAKLDAGSESSPSAPKPRRLPLQSSGRGVTKPFIDEAKRDMQVRRMPYNEADLQWLREARLKVYSLNGKMTGLQKEQKDLGIEFTRHYKAASKAAKSAREKDKAKSSDAGAETAESSTSSKEAEAEEESSGDAETGSRKDGEEHIKQLKESARKIKEELDKVHKQQEEIRARSHNIRMSWPNHCHPDVPVGPEENAVVLSVKDPLDILPKEFDVMKEPWNESVMQAKHFPDGPKPDPKRDHLSLAGSAASAEVDMVSGLLSTGSSWPYLLGSISLLEHALSQYAMSIAVRNGFLPVSPPDVVRADLADRCGFRPRDEKARQTYFIEGTKSKSAEQESSQSAAELCLAATAEIPLAGLLAARTLDNSKKARKRASSHDHESSLIQRSELPIKLAALGHAFRAEAGARGADTRGLYRVHQFSKIEMFVATDGNMKASNAMLEELRGVQEEVIGGLGLPYRVLDMPTEELGASAYRKYDIEVWMPGRGSWGEVSSASNCTAYQALRLGIKLKNASAPSKNDDDLRYATAHTLNATAAAIPRLIVAILENHGVEKGKLVLPDTLKPFWLAGHHDPNVKWLYTGKLEDGSQSRLKRALMHVRSIARKNGTDAPTMVASFLVLHELTAIVPLVLMFYVFGALGVGTAVLHWLLGDAETEHDAQSLASRFRTWARTKEERFERYCRRKGYLGFEQQDAATIDAAKDLGSSNYLAGSFANMVAAYILVKALLPIRIGASIALAGPFSRTVLEPLKNLVRRRVRATRSAAS